VPQQTQARKPRKKKIQPLFDGAEWNFQTLRDTYAAVEEIALNDLGLDVYPNQIEIISAEQMLDAYCSIGMPLMYQHWSYGKRFVQEQEMYRTGHMGLAYEIVINSSPCISYYMEESTMPLQALTIAHAAFGHNHFFKNNYLFQQWTDAEGILDYLEFAKRYIARCEERHGIEAVEEILDAAHALMDQGIFRYRRHPKPNLRQQEERERQRRAYNEQHYNDLWRTLPESKAAANTSEAERELAERKKQLKLPEENLLYFIEKNSPVLENWEREIVRIVRNISQYFYPQKQTKVMNEGCATFVHYYIVNELYDKGLLTEGALMEILHSHSSVIMQPGFDDPRFSGVNPYALGFAMMQDIKRITTEPTDEDRHWFPDIAGTGDWRKILRDAWANYRDESFIRQYLSPHLIREFKLFQLQDVSRESHVTIAAIHDDAGYEKIRDVFANSYDVPMQEPDIQIVDVDLLGDRKLLLHHKVNDGIPLAMRTRKTVLLHLRRLWGYDVGLAGIDGVTGETRYEVRPNAAKDDGESSS
jgi:spore cortex formation protein SpoVR/YcgB (stage V sporulation)